MVGEPNVSNILCKFSSLNGTWETKASHGSSHELNCWENTVHWMGPEPAPHCDTHKSYVQRGSWDDAVEEVFNEHAEFFHWSLEPWDGESDEEQMVKILTESLPGCLTGTTCKTTRSTFDMFHCDQTWRSRHNRPATASTRNRDTNATVPSTYPLVRLQPISAHLIAASPNTNRKELTRPNNRAKNKCQRGEISGRDVGQWQTYGRYPVVLLAKGYRRGGSSSPPRSHNSMPYICCSV